MGSFFGIYVVNLLVFRGWIFLENEIIKINCELERFFPPIFSDTMVYLPVHLLNEIRTGGLVQ